MRPRLRWCSCPTYDHPLGYWECVGAGVVGHDFLMLRAYNIWVKRMLANKNQIVLQSAAVDGINDKSKTPDTTAPLEGTHQGG